MAAGLGLFQPRFCQSAIESAQNDQMALMQAVLADKETHMKLGA